MSREEAKTNKTIRDYPIKKSNPFIQKNDNEGYISRNKSFSVNVVPNGETDSMSLTGIHKVHKDKALEILGEILREKLDITKGGINVFKYIYNNIDKVEQSNEDGEIMTFKVNFDDCRDVCGYNSTQSVWYGLAELLDKDIIARSGVPGVYYLNPNFFHPAGSIVVTEYYKLT